MGTKNTTTSTNQYNAPSMTAYHGLTAAGTNVLQSNISSPYNNAFFNNQKAQAGNAAAGFGTSAGNANSQIFSALGTPNTNSFLNTQNAAQGRANLATNARMQNNLILGAANTRNQSINAGMMFRPLQTGGTMTQQTGGIGSWLPQLAVAALGGATGAMQQQQSNASPQFAGGYFNNGQIGTTNTLDQLPTHQENGQSYYGS